MKILILSDDFPPKSFGGAGIIAYSQAKELLKRGHEISVITATDDRKVAGVKNIEGMMIHVLYTKYNPRLRAYRSMNNPEVVANIESIISEFGPDVVHAHNIHQFLSYKSLEIARKQAKRVFLTAHDSMLIHYSKVYPRSDYKIGSFEQARYFWREWNPLRNLLIRRYLRNVDNILVVSKALEDVLRQNGITNTEVLHNGIDAQGFKASDGEIDEFRDRYGLRGKKVMLFGGRLGRAKGGEIALKLLREISKVMPEVVLLIAGKTDGSVRKEENVIFTGWLDRSMMPAAYGASDVVLTLSTYIDPFPTVNLEAMAAGKPVIGTCFGGTPEAVKDGVTGFIVDPNNIDEVKEKTLRLLKDHMLAEQFGQAGNYQVLREFQLSIQVDKLEKMYNLINP